MSANPAVRLVFSEPESAREPESELALYRRKTRETVDVLSESLTCAFFGDYSIRVRTPADAPEELHSLGLLVNGIINSVRHSLSRETRLQNEYIQALSSSIGEGVLRLDMGDRILFANSAAERILGWSSDELFGKPFHDIFQDNDPNHPSPLFTIHESAGTYTSTSNFLRRNDGKEIPVAITANPLIIDGQCLGINVVFRDISEQRKLEAQLRQAQKMESIGRLVGGIAHDFNNILTVINGYSEYGLSKDCDNSGHKDCLAEIFSAGKKAAALTQHLLAYSRQQIVSPVVIDLNQQLRTMQKMLTRLLGETINLQTYFSEVQCYIKMDPIQVEQVILNLVVNAKDAMSSGGDLILEVENTILDGAYVSQYPDVKAGAYVLLTVSDTGTGMTKEVMEHLFEPYFTTKEKGEGTGLGLATCYGIVKQVGGHISFYSEIGHGTTFKIYLPLVEGERIVEEKAGPQPSCPSFAATTTILVVEDDSMVRKLVTMCLDSCGYKTIVAHSPENAIQVMTDDNPPKVDLLLTDVVMPNMNGKELVAKLKTLAPQMKVVFMSGYTKNTIVHNGSLDAGTVFIQKPFTVNNLLSVIEKALKDAI